MEMVTKLCFRNKLFHLVLQIHDVIMAVKLTTMSKNLQVTVTHVCVRMALLHVPTILATKVKN